MPYLTLLILTPWLGAVLIALLGATGLDDRLSKIIATAWSLIPLVLALLVWAGFDTSASDAAALQFVERIPWINAIKVEYFVGVDGISLPLVILTTVMTPIAMLASFGIAERAKWHYALLLMLEGAMLGYFVALNFFFFFIFWEFSLVPAFFLIQHWGRHPEKRRSAALTFFVYTMGGSIGLLLLFQFFYLATNHFGLGTFDLIALGSLGQGLDPNLPTLQELIFGYVHALGITDLLGYYPLLYSSIACWAIFIAFAIKLAVWPFHTWLPDTYSEAPISTSILLSAVMSKMGAYGLLRIMLPMLPEASQYAAYPIGMLALAGILAGAFGALRNSNGDIKRMVAYTSINHMGYVALAIAAAAAVSGADLNSRAIAINGAQMQMVAHGLSTGALFLLIGMLYQRTNTYQLSEYGGLRKTMPLFSGLMGIALFANLGLPGLAGFVGEFFIFRGAWASMPLYTILACIGLVVTALALLKLYSKVFNGPLNPQLANTSDLPIASREFMAIAPLIVILIILGLYPAPIMDLANQTITALVRVFAS